MLPQPMTSKNGLPGNPQPLSTLPKAQFLTARDTISEIEDMLTEAEALLIRLQPGIQTAIHDYHNEHGTLRHCLRWGLQAAKEVREDWHTVAANIPCDMEGGS